MRVFIFLCCATVFSFTPNNAVSQNSRIKIDADKTLTVDEVFDLIKQQTDYKFIYEEGIFKDFQSIEVKKGIIRTNKLLQKSLSQGDFNLVVTTNNTILIKEKSKAQQKQVSGKVIDEEGLPLPGVVVLIKGTTNGTATNFDGTYSITVPTLDNVLVFSFLGFETQEITVGNQSTINLVLEEELAELAEVVVTGYQQISKERSTGAYAKPEMSTLKDRSTSMNVLQRLDGLVPGLVINNAPNNTIGSSNDSGILIRGLSTINGNQNPLFVVDGVALADVSSLNPQDVEDITVLKDATAASIWGARAANGVIVITTKRGGFNKKTRIDYDTFINFQGKPDLDYRPVLNSQQFIQTARELFDPGTFPYNSQLFYNQQSGPTKNISVHNQILYDLDNGVINQTTADAMLNDLANTNNLSQIEDLLYRNAYINNHTLSVQGGGEKHAFYGSIAYTNNQSSSPGEKDETYKLNVRQDFKIGERVNFRLNTDLTNSVTEAKRAIQADNRFTPYALFQDGSGNNLTMNALQHFSNFQRPDLENVSGINLDYTPLDEVNYGFTDANALSARLTAGLTIDLFKGLKYEGTYGYFHQNSKSESFDSQDSYGVRSDIIFFTIPGANPGDNPTFHLPTEGGYYRTFDRFVKNWTFRNQLAYDGSFNDGLHKVTALAGYESQEQLFNNRQNFIRGYDLRSQLAPALDYEALRSGITGTLVVNSFGRSRITNSNEPFGESEVLFRFTSMYANAAYTFNNKYTISGSVRADESNLFGLDKSAQNRPVWSAGLKWNIGKEDFMSGVNWIDNLALRGTYGITGNSPAPGGAASFDVLRTRATNTFAYTAGLANEITAPGNKKLTWERTENLNIGLDFGIFNNRLRGSLDYYENKTDDLLDEILTNTFTGFAQIPGNSGSLENKGIEVSLQTLNIDGDFSWHTGLTLGYNKNKITSLNSSANTITNVQVGLRPPQPGYSAFPIFAYDFVGLNNEGSPEIRLADGTITSEQGAADFEDLLFMGTYQPKWSGGFTNSFSYKGLALTANMIYNLGHVMFTDTPGSGAYSGRPLEGGRNSFTRGNVHADFVNRWQQPGDEANTNTPGYTPLSNTLDRDIRYYKYGDINVTSASYIKLRDISLSYTLPDTVIQKINASHLSFRLMLNNVMLWKDNNKGIDPEFHDAAGGSRFTTPFNQSSVTFGMHLTF
ncbi:SusC/RagA family TonB-linked outer membrane protein [Flavivirga spongiicola]|uniref:SusC/RagA family TonB-linked outer membrane protein n=1 Tax=Flavivirga spongiicola TaxID=421621 RepID=A0ABU7XSD8_9FLAO|nr:SusC/RagA family TonB-linked outer membrane protein [Flavivirga sp. MEBiC05379]MDO5978373.1 SusC/RagA family TonB-linked outer membrane protein [Flavivirga sp. MEBiC05379]